MNISAILFLLMTLFALMLGSNNSDKNRKIYIFISCGLFLLVSSLRSLSYGMSGSDTLTYYTMYTNMDDYSLRDIWRMFVNRYVKGTNEEDIGYVLLQRLIYYITTDFHVFTFLAELLLFFIPYGIWLYRYSNNILNLLFANIFFLALIFSHVITGSRQLYAMGLGILFFLFFTEKKYIKAFIALIAGVSIHLSLLLLLIPLALKYLNPTQLKVLHILLFLGFPIVMLMPNQIIAFMGSFIGSEKYEAYGLEEVKGGTETFIFLLEFLSLVCLIGIKRSSIVDKTQRFIYVMAPCFTFFGPLIYSNGSMIRVSMYFYIYLIMLIPYAFQDKFVKNQKSLMVGFIIALSALQLTGSNSSYHFFWQVDPAYTW